MPTQPYKPLPQSRVQAPFAFQVNQVSQKQAGYTQEAVNALRGKGNEERVEFDLGKDGAFSDFSVLVGAFQGAVRGSWDANAGKALSQKGFRVTFIENELEFINQLKNGNFDVTWIISGASNTTQLKPAQIEDFKSAVLNYHRSGRGLFLMSDNDPLFVHTNWILPDIAGTRVIGNTPGDRVLGYGTGSTSGEFDADHLIFSGINYLYEGVTICYPETNGKLTHLATSTDGHPCISFMDSTPEHGRVLVETGYTKLYYRWDSAGQSRYLVNGTVYLVDVERRFK
jgi:hypothetical protein